MALEVSGKIIKILPIQSGTGKNGTWSRQEFVIETQEQYPRKICISAWGDKTSMLAQCEVGTSIKASVNIESREFNDKWYTDVRAWKIEPANNDFENYVADAPFVDEPMVDNSQKTENFLDIPDDELPF